MQGRTLFLVLLLLSRSTIVSSVPVPSDPEPSTDSSEPTPSSSPTTTTANDSPSSTSAAPPSASSSVDQAQFTSADRPDPVPADDHQSSKRWLGGVFNGTRDKLSAGAVSKAVNRVEKSKRHGGEAQVVYFPPASQVASRLGRQERISTTPRCPLRSARGHRCNKHCLTMTLRRQARERAQQGRALSSHSSTPHQSHVFKRSASPDADPEPVEFAHEGGGGLSLGQYGGQVIDGVLVHFNATYNASTIAKEKEVLGVIARLSARRKDEEDEDKDSDDGKSEYEGKSSKGYQDEDYAEESTEAPATSSTADYSSSKNAGGTDYSESTADGSTSPAAPTSAYAPTAADPASAPAAIDPSTAASVSSTQAIPATAATLLPGSLEQDCANLQAMYTAMGGALWTIQYGWDGHTMEQDQAAVAPAPEPVAAVASVAASVETVSDTAPAVASPADVPSAATSPDIASTAAASPAPVAPVDTASVAAAPLTPVAPVIPAAAAPLGPVMSLPSVAPLAEGFRSYAHDNRRRSSVWRKRHSAGKSAAALDTTSVPAAVAPTCCSWYGVGCSTSGRVASLDLANNGLSGSLAAGVYQLNALTRLNVSLNAITFVPDAFQSMSSLKTVFMDSLAIPELSPVPSTLQSLPTLVNLNIAINNFTGSVVLSSGYLENVHLDANQLTNVTFAGSQAALARVSFASNGMNGGLPDLSKATGLISLDASNNGFTGNLFDLSGLKSLTRLDVSTNGLMGGLPKTLINNPNMAALDISRNGFIGSLPAEDASTVLTSCNVQPNSLMTCPTAAELDRPNSLASRCNAGCQAGNVVKAGASSNVADLSAAGVPAGLLTGEGNGTNTTGARGENGGARVVTSGAVAGGATMWLSLVSIVVCAGLAI